MEIEVNSLKSLYLLIGILNFVKSSSVNEGGDNLPFLDFKIVLLDCISSNNVFSCILFDKTKKNLFLAFEKDIFAPSPLDLGN